MRRTSEKTTTRASRGVRADGPAQRRYGGPRAILVLALAAGLGGLATLGAAAWTAVAAHDDGLRVETAAMAALLELGDAIREDILRIVEPAMTRTRIVAEDPRVVEVLRAGGDRERLTRIANDAVRGATEIDVLALFGADGRIRAISTVLPTGRPVDPERVRRVLAMDFDAREIVQRCVRSDASEPALEFQIDCDITPAYFDSTGLSVAYSVPVVDPRSGARLGVASARLRFERFTRLIERRSLGGAGAVHFVSDAGEYFSESIRRGEAPPPVDPAALRDVVVPLARERVSRSLTHMGNELIAVLPLRNLAALPGGGIHVMIVADRAWATRELRHERRARAAQTALLGTLLLVTALAFWGARLAAGGREALEDARRRAENASRAKSEFLANMSHEIRTPMAAILGFADELRDELRDRPRALDYLEIIRRNGEHLLTLINDILDLSKIEAGRMHAERIDASAVQIVADVASLMRVRADAKGLEFVVRFDGPLPQTIQTDPTRVRQVLINLIGNACKFTERGQVRLEVRLVADGPPRIEFDVIDSGIGMTPDQIARCFDAFTQGDASTVRRFGGTGLGLTISRRLANSLGGDVRVVESVPGRGTRFRFTLPVAADAGLQTVDDPHAALSVAPAPPAPDTGERPLAGVRVLLAEDGPDNQRLITLILRKAGAEVTLAENGRDAVEAALRASRDGSPFDVVLMDMQMPVMSGYEATAALRQVGYDGAIVALTAHTMASDRETCLEAGCDDFAAKPIQRREFLDVIRRATRTTGDGAARPEDRLHV